MHRHELQKERKPNKERWKTQEFYDNQRRKRENAGVTVCDKLLRFPTKDQDGRKTQELQYDKLLRFPSLVFCNILVHSIAQNPLGRKPEIHRTVQDSAYIGMIQSTMDSTSTVLVQ